MILVFDTANENVFLGLWDDKWLTKTEFVGGRELNKLIIVKLEDTFSHSAECENFDDCFKKLTGIVVNAGPGSFTGLRIGLSVANAIAYSEDIPIVGVANETDPEKLLQKGLAVLKSRSASFEGAIVPFYGAEPNITKPKG
jgi:tRNA threonylcarbamoyladenosine biosynthesis protein TsaB